MTEGIVKTYRVNYSERINYEMFIDAASPEGAKQLFAMLLAEDEIEETDMETLEFEAILIDDIGDEETAASEQPTDEELEQMVKDAAKRRAN